MSHFVKWEAPFYTGFGGDTSVEIFFLVSGFYIALILENSYKSIRNFYFNRFLRLYPTYFVVCFFILLVALIRAGFRENLFSFPALPLSLASFSNLTLIGTDWLMFFDTSNGSIHLTGPVLDGVRMRDLLWVAPAWSLGIEITFYALAPKICKLRSSTLIALGATSVIARIFSFQLGLNYSPWDTRFFPFELSFFLLGILIFRARRYFASRPKISTLYLYPLLIVSFILFEFIRDSLSMSRLGVMTILTAIAVGVILFGEDNPIDRKIGDLSYPIYICHVFVGQLYGFGETGAGERIPLLENNHFSISIQIVLVVITSIALLRLVRPVEKLRDKVRAG